MQLLKRWHTWRIFTLSSSSIRLHIKYKFWGLKSFLESQELNSIFDSEVITINIPSSRKPLRITLIEALSSNFLFFLVFYSGKINKCKFSRNSTPILKRVDLECSQRSTSSTLWWKNMQYLFYIWRDLPFCLFFFFGSTAG